MADELDQNLLKEFVTYSYQRVKDYRNGSTTKQQATDDIANHIKKEVQAHDTEEN